MFSCFVADRPGKTVKNLPVRQFNFVTTNLIRMSVEIGHTLPELLGVFHLMDGVLQHFVVVVVAGNGLRHVEDF